MSVVKIEDLSNGVRVVTLNRPKPNAFDIDLMVSVSEAMCEAAERSEIRAVVLTGEGDFFSAGLDFKAMMQAQGGGEAGAKRFSEAMEKAFIDVWTCPRPTVAAINGHAIAAGFLIAIGADFRFVYEGSGQYGLNEVLFGAGFPPIAIEMGRYVMGHNLHQAILTGQLFDWKGGLENKSFDQSFPSKEALMSAAIEKAAWLGTIPKEAYAHIKEQLIAPYLQQVLAEPEEHKKKTASIFTTQESSQAMMKYMMELSSRKG